MQFVTCPQCNGNKVVERTGSDNMDVYEQICPNCKGVGQVSIEEPKLTPTPIPVEDIMFPEHGDLLAGRLDDGTPILVLSFSVVDKSYKFGLDSQSAKNILELLYNTLRILEVTKK